MRVFDEQLVELHRPDAERVIERNLGAQQIASEAAVSSDVVALLERGTLAEQ